MVRYADAETVAVSNLGSGHKLFTKKRRTGMAKARQIRTRATTKKARARLRHNANGAGTDKTYKSRGKGFNLATYTSVDDKGNKMADDWEDEFHALMQAEFQNVVLGNDKGKDKHDGGKHDVGKGKHDAGKHGGKHDGGKHYYIGDGSTSVHRLQILSTPTTKSSWSRQL